MLLSPLPPPPQDFTILILIAAGSASLALEALVNGGGGGDPNWIEGASILAAGALRRAACLVLVHCPLAAVPPLVHTHAHALSTPHARPRPPPPRPPPPLAAVCVVVLVGAASNYQKEAQFRALQAASDDAKVGARVGCAAGAPAPAINPSLDVSLRASTACCLLLAVAPCTRRRCHRCGRSGGGARCSWRPPRCWWAMCWYWTPVTSCALTACCSPPAT